MEHKTFYEARLAGIETISLGIEPRPGDFNGTQFNFNLSSENKVSPEKSILFFKITIDLFDELNPKTLGHCSVLFKYELKDFDKYIVYDEINKTYIIPEDLNFHLRTISISTMRGIMHSAFSNSYLRGATLPIIGKLPLLEKLPQE